MIGGLSMDREIAERVRRELPLAPEHAPGSEFYVGPTPLDVPSRLLYKGALLADGRVVCEVFDCEGEDWCIIGAKSPKSSGMYQ